MSPPQGRRLLVPLDGSRLAERIVPRLQGLLRAPDEVVLLHVHPEGGDAAGLEQGLASLERMQATLKQLGLPSTGMQRGGDPAATICEVAETVEPWALAMSTHGRSGLGRWWAGSVTERVLRTTHCPVLAANPGAVESPGVPAVSHPFAFTRLLVPLDGSALARAILPLAVTLAKVAGGTVHLAHVIPAGAGATEHLAHVIPAGAGATEAGATPVEPAAARRAEAGARLEAAAAELERAKVPVEHHVCAGQPAGALLDLIAELDADAVAMTTHGRSGLARWAFGSVAEKLLRHAPCPLFVWRVGTVPAAGAP